VNFPAWTLGHHPNWEFIMASYAVDLPLDFSRRIRAQVRSDEYRQMFPNTVLSRDSQAAEAWRTTKRGGLRAAGVGGGITGRGAHCLIIDDPIKDEQEADSEPRRALVWGWYSSTAYTRLSPGGGVCVIQTRWHHDDLSGRLQRQMKEDLAELQTKQFEVAEAMLAARTTDEKQKAQQALDALLEAEESIDMWEIVDYQALARYDEYLDTNTGAIVKDRDKDIEPTPRLQLLRKAGDALHPERMDRRLLLRYKRTLQDRHWSALYMQEPTAEEGAFFERGWLIRRPNVPSLSELVTFAAWDLAIGTKNQHDYSVGMVGGLDWLGNLWVVDCWRMRAGSMDVLARAIIDLHVRGQCRLTGIEKGILELAVKPDLLRIMRQEGRRISLAEGNRALRPMTDKMVRARPLQGRMQQGSFYLPDDAPWVDLFETEALQFPAGVHDDMVDCASWLARMAGWFSPPPKPLSQRMPLVGGFRSWRDRLAAQTMGEKNFMAR
jgi:predicted phage terminase large subunit-like protein